MKKIAYVCNLLIFCLIFSSCSSYGNAACVDNNIEYALIEKTKEIINEKNYFQNDNDETNFVGYDICYDIYSDGSDYFVVTKEENICYSFSKYENNYYYTGNENYDTASKISSGTFKIESVYVPDYNMNNNIRVTRFLDYETVLSSVISNCKRENFYTVYLLGSFPWDKSNYLNGSEQISIMLTDDNGNVIVTYCYFNADGWHIGTPGFEFNQEEYPKLVQKYKDTAVCSKSNI